MAGNESTRLEITRDLVVAWLNKTEVMRNNPQGTAEVTGKFIAAVYKAIFEEITGL